MQRFNPVRQVFLVHNRHVLERHYPLEVMLGRIQELVQDVRRDHGTSQTGGFAHPGDAGA